MKEKIHALSEEMVANFCLLYTSKQKATTIDDVRVAVCPECGYTEMYLEDLTKLKS